MADANGGAKPPGEPERGLIAARPHVWLPAGARGGLAPAGEGCTGRSNAEQRARAAARAAQTAPPPALTRPAAAKASSFKAAAGLGLAIQNPTHDVATATEEPPPVDALPTPTVRAAA